MHTSPMEDSDMKTCMYCGTICSDTASFCSACGKPLMNGYDQANAGTRSGFDQAGSGQNGYDRGGYNQAGYQQNGYDQGGYNQAGYQQNGYDRSGYNQAGYQQGAYDQNGRSQAGYQQGGYDQGGYQQAGYGSGPSYAQNGYNGVPNRFDGGYYPVNVMGLAPRNIALCIVFSIITFGIYSIYWFIKLTDEMNQASGDVKATSGGLAFVFTLITFGIYGIYWAYKMGEKTERIRQDGSSTSVLYLVLSLIGFSIIVYALAQSTLNNSIEAVYAQQTY